MDALDAFFLDGSNAGYFEADEADNFVANNSADYEVEENILAAYVMGTTHFGDLEVIGGVRVEQTDVSARGKALNGNTASWTSASADYTNVIPSLIANYRINDEWIARAGVTRALGRPGFETIAPRATVSEDGGAGGQCQYR